MWNKLIDLFFASSEGNEETPEETILALFPLPLPEEPGQYELVAVDEAGNEHELVLECLAQKGEEYIAKFECGYEWKSTSMDETRRLLSELTELPLKEIDPDGFAMAFSNQNPLKGATWKRY